MKKILLLLFISTNFIYSQIQEVTNNKNPQIKIGEAKDVSLVHNTDMGQYNFTYFDARYKKLMEITTFSFEKESDLDVLYDALINAQFKEFKIHEGTLYIENKKGKVRMSFSEVDHIKSSAPTEWLKPEDVKQLFGK